MKKQNWRCLAFGLIGFAVLGDANRLYAEEARSLPEGMTQAKLEKTVLRQFQYLGKRLLSDKSAQKIEASGNEEAIAILKEARITRDKIARQIEQKQFRAAYWALQELNNSLKVAMKLSRAKDRARKELLDTLENVRIINDAYFDMAKKMNIDGERGSRDAFVYYQRALEQRAQANDHFNTKDVPSAIEDYEFSTQTLKRAIAVAKEWRNNVQTK